jgi:hypothetical protein
MVGEFINPKKCYIKFYKKRERERERVTVKVCLKVWLRLLFKVFLTQKCIKIIYFLFFKFIFDINASKRFKNTKKILILNKKKLKF